MGRRRLATHMEGYAAMQPEWTAAIISTDIEPAILQQLADALRAAGWNRVNTVGDYSAAASLKETGAGDSREFHLPAALKGSRFLLLDELIGGRSAFELFTILKAAAERQEFAAGILLNPPADQPKVFAAWAAGFDLCLTKPVNPEELARFAKRIRETLKEQEGGAQSV
jgi:DNA-binding response OmpR family regulator